MGTINIASYLVMLFGYLLTIFTSGYIVRFFVGSGVARATHNNDGKFDVGTIIGKCENFITLTFVLSSEYTGLAIIFTAKSIIRMETMRKEPKYYLGGTLINLCYSMLMGFLIRAILRATGYFL